ncbi:MAG: phosphoenolpyruvate kinase [Proteobacteria bacterium]|nr:MAG: phosphoenolpyruvate kinase [Pseudomonadota bacterium]
MTGLSLSQAQTAKLLAEFGPTGDSIAAITEQRRPIHTFYGGAHLFKPEICAKLGKVALDLLKAYGPDPDTLADGLELREGYRPDQKTYDLVLGKLAKEPIEDYRIDFEDGFGSRSPEDEDQAAISSAECLIQAAGKGILPPFCGLRIRALGSDTRERALRTLDLFITKAVSSGGKLPDNFVVTLPKATSSKEIEVLVKALDILEQTLKLNRSIGVELLIETPRAIFGGDGRIAVSDLIEAGKGRVKSLHLGLYDLTSALGVSSQSQSLNHHICTFARTVMQFAAAGRGINVVDSITNTIPAPLHKEKDNGTPLSPQRIEENRRAVFHGWKCSFSNIWRALESGIYQGWDIHPAQLPMRYLATFIYFRRDLRESAARLAEFEKRSSQASLTGTIFDDQASILGIRNYLNVAINCGATSSDELSCLL